MSEIQRCRAHGCGKPMVWAVTENNKRIPLDADETGNPVAHPGTTNKGRLQQVAELFAPDGPMRVRMLREDEDPDPSSGVFISHFATCIEAHTFRAG